MTSPHRELLREGLPSAAAVRDQPPMRTPVAPLPATRTRQDVTALDLPHLPCQVDQAPRRVAPRLGDAMPKASRRDIDAARRLVRGRDSHYCQMCGVSIVDIPSAVHHRVAKQMGGSAKLERASNLVRLCGSGNADGCHGKAHQNPQWARNHGWIVSRSFDPTEIPVDMVDGWFLLGDDGSRTPCAPREAVG